MAEFNITNTGVTVTDDAGNSMTISNDSPKYSEAVDAVLGEDYDEFRDIVFRDDEDDEPERTLPAGMVMGIASSFEDMAEQIKEATGVDILEDVCNCEDSEHDLSNWNGSPIYYLTKEQAMEQVSKSCGFWAYHDFGVEARCGRRYATVPTGFGPTAPEGYEWACVSIED